MKSRLTCGRVALLTLSEQPAGALCGGWVLAGGAHLNHAHWRGARESTCCDASAYALDERPPVHTTAIPVANRTAVQWE